MRQSTRKTGAINPQPLTDEISFPDCNKLRNKPVSEANAEKLTENHLCPTCKTISVPYQA